MTILNPLFNIIPLIFVLISTLLLFISYFSTKIRYNYFFYQINTFFIIIFLYILTKYTKKMALLQNNFFYESFFSFLNYNHYFSQMSFYIYNNLFFLVFLLFLFITICFTVFLTKKTQFFTLPSKKYITYYIALYLSIIIIFYVNNMNFLFNSSFNLLNIIIILECFTLLTIYITMKMNINVLNNLILYFFYSVFGYILYVIGCSLYIYVFGNDLITLQYSLISIFNKFELTKYINILEFANILFFVSFSLKLYLFPFSNIIDKLYNSINLIEIIIISFIFVPSIYLIFMQFLSMINWFNKINTSYLSFSTNLFFFISLITFIYSIFIAIDKNNLKSLVAFSSINTSSFFLMLIALSFNLIIEWYSYFFLYQITYLLIFFIFILLLILPNKKNIEQTDFFNITNNLMNVKFNYIMTILFIISITMVLPPIFFIKNELIVSFFFLNVNEHFANYNIVYLFIIIIYSISSYILYIRIFKSFKLFNVNYRYDKKIINNKNLIKFFKNR